MSEVNSGRVVFFDVRGTLGEVDRPGHLVVYKPSTEQLLEGVKSIGGRRGIIMNLPSDVSAEQGRKMLDDAGITPYLEPAGIIINHDAPVDKPQAEIYRYAAERMGVPVEQCLFLGENLLEVVGAWLAGMNSILKPCPPGREFDRKPIRSQPGSSTDSGRLFEKLVEEDHLIGGRIVRSAFQISAWLKEGKEPPLAAMQLLVFLLLYYVDPFHHRKEEEAILPLALARGFPAKDAEFMKLEHDQGRLYFRSMDLALRRIHSGHADAIEDFKPAIDGFCRLYRDHKTKEDDILFPSMGSYFTDNDDLLAINLMEQIGPRDIAPWIDMIAALEKAVPMEQA